MFTELAQSGVIGICVALIVANVLIGTLVTYGVAGIRSGLNSHSTRLNRREK